MAGGSNVALVHRPIGTGRAALFLDRDGVINIDTGYLSDPAHVTLRQGAAAMIAAFNAAAWPVIVVSNQSGYGRGYFSCNAMLAVQEQIEALLAADGAYLDAVFLCGMAPERTDALAAWRKPEPGMLLAAQRLLGVDLATSFLVGDKVSDLQAAAGAGLRGGFFVGAEDTDLTASGLPARAVRDLAHIRPTTLDVPHD